MSNETKTPKLEVMAFGQGHARVNGKELTQWDGSLPRQLFFFLVDNMLVTRDQIFGIFWPSLPVKEATNVFHVTKRKIGERLSEMISDGIDYELTAYSSGFYIPSKNIDRTYDVAEFEECVNNAQSSDDTDEQIKLYQRAFKLYKGDFLTTLNLDWVKTRRSELQMMYVDTLIGLGRILRDREHNEESLSYFVRALKLVATREDIHREVMSLYYKLGRRADAVEQYINLEKLLQDSLKVAPSKETRALYDQIRKS